MKQQHCLIHNSVTHLTQILGYYPHGTDSNYPPEYCSTIYSESEHRPCANVVFHGPYEDPQLVHPTFITSTFQQQTVPFQRSLLSYLINLRSPQLVVRHRTVPSLVQRNATPKELQRIRPIGQRCNPLNHISLNEQTKPSISLLSEALSLIDKHTALSSSSETRNKNYLALSQHLTDKDYDLLSGSMEDLLTEITQILQNETDPFVPAKKTDDTPVVSAQAKEMISKLPSLHSISQSEGSDKIEEHSSYQVAATKPPAAPIVVKKLFTKEPEAISSGLQHNSTFEHLKELPVITQSGTIPHEPQAGSTIQGDVLQDILTNFMKNFDKKFQDFSEKTEHKLQQMKQLQGHLFQQLEGLQDNMSLVQDQLNQHTMTKEQASEISEINQDNEDKDEYEVEKIHCMQIEKGGGTLTKRGSASRITFLVKWADHKQKTWEPIESFEGGHRTPGEQHPLIREFLRQGTNLAKYRKMKIAIASESKHVSSVKRFIKREESIHSISNLLDVRLDENGDMEFLVESNGNFESSWQPMRHFPGGEKSNKAILDFLNLERNRRKYEDLKLEVVRIKARKLRKSGVSKISKNPKSLKKESEKPKDPEDSKINEVFDESKLENSEEQEVQEISLAVKCLKVFDTRVEERKFYVSKVSLSSNSPYFATLFMGQAQESEKSEIELKDVNPYYLQYYLELIYGEDALDEDTVGGILNVADMYNTLLAIKKCEEYLMEKSKMELRNKLKLAGKYRLEKLKKMCLDQIKTKEDIRSIVPKNTREMNLDILAELLDKSLALI
ncbi:hypothetical protein L5515_015306 [Caenorhabditis briggsae]|uniref:Uncharacterized protein n=1 Tax=Caenorhabditis briggsae TaxID=6238 RepID=A0AAE9J9Y3_CAEBR|nr:hypothetical protein L5515_015306 [Caenorhabditis briggsae]